MDQDLKDKDEAPMTAERLLLLAESLPEKEAFDLLEKHWLIVWENKPGLGLLMLHNSLQRALWPSRRRRPPIGRKPLEDEVRVLVRMRKEGPGSSYWNEVRSSATDVLWKSYLFWGKDKGWFPKDAE